MNYGKNSVSSKKKQLRSSAKKLGTKTGVTLFKLCILAFIAIVVTGSCVVFGMVKGVIDSAPDIASVNVSPTGYATKIYDCNGTETQRLVAAGSNRVFKSIDQIPIQLQHAFIAIEDQRFYEHNGIDMKGILRAASLVLTTGKMSQGASTITQQLLKNNVFNAYNESDMEKIKRKIQEQYLALKLETYMDKDAILENYLNTINLGNGYLGVQSAANGYFNKDVSELTLSECAVIASITKNPIGLNPIRYPEDNRERMEKVLNDMFEQGYISKEEQNEALADDVYARLQGLETESGISTNSYFVDALIEELAGDLMETFGYTSTQAYNMIYAGGLSIYSTQDLEMQAVADSVINDPDWYPSRTQVSISYYLTVKHADGTTKNYSHLSLQRYFQTDGGMAGFSLTFSGEEDAQQYIDQYKAAIIGEGDSILGENLTFSIQPQISFSIVEQATGHIKVIVGGRGDKTGNRIMNRATETARQSGSSIKPLAVYGPALDTNAITLATAWDDAPYYYSGEEAQLITNYEKNYLGLMSTRFALYKSRNVPAVKCLTQITPAVGFGYLQKLGFTTLISPSNAINGHHDVVQSLALGGLTKGVTNLEMTAAYSAIANGGVYTEPIYYTQVYDHDGNLILDNTTPHSTRIFKETTAWLLTSAMKDVVQIGTGGSAKIDGMEVAAKTGTTNFHGDIWFCAFSPYYTASVWVGYDDNSVLTTSINHAGIWGEIMRQIHSDQNLEPKGFPQPEGIVEKAVCSQSGLLPVEGLCDADPRGSQIVTEYFSEDNVPTESCTTHVKVKICKTSGDVATSACTNTETRIFIKKPVSDTIVPEGATEYTVGDEEYAITDEKLSKLCSLHRSSTGSTSNTTGTTGAATTRPGTTSSGR